MGYLNRFQGRLLLHTNTGTIQEISIQGTAIWTVHSTHGVHCDSKIGGTDGHTQGYKNPPVPRRLVGEGQIPPRLSPAYSGASRDLSKIRLVGEHGEIRAGLQASLQLCRLPVQPQVWLGPTDTGLVAEPSTKNTNTPIPTGLSDSANRSANSHRKASSPRLTTYETHTVASQKQLEGTGMTSKGHSHPQVLASHLK